MADSSEAIQRIEGDFGAFRDGIQRCSVSGAFVRADLKDAYARLGRLRERYLKEKSNLTTSQRVALSKVFEEDTFTEGMMNIRQVGEHVERRGGLVIRTTDNAPITLDHESSAMAVFSAAYVVLNDTDGHPHGVDHLKLLEEMENRIHTALQRAKSNS